MVEINLTRILTNQFLLLEKYLIRNIYESVSDLFLYDSINSCAIKF